jgi:putative membrane protein
MATTPEQDPRVYFAAERTFLAWIRTGLGLMGVGFAVARFGLFLRQIRATETHAPMAAGGMSVWSGVAIVFLGVIVLASSTAQHCALYSRAEYGDLASGSDIAERGGAGFAAGGGGRRDVGLSDCCAVSRCQSSEGRRLRSPRLS